MLFWVWHPTCETRRKTKGDMKCVVLFKKDVVFCLKRTWFGLKRKLRGKIVAIKRGERWCLKSCKDNKCHGKLEGNASKVWTISRSKHVSKFGLETLALLIGPKRTFHIALGKTCDDKVSRFQTRSQLANCQVFETRSQTSRCKIAMISFMRYRMNENDWEKLGIICSIKCEDF